jgi:hypothetical protein
VDRNRMMMRWRFDVEIDTPRIIMSKRCHLLVGATLVVLANACSSSTDETPSNGASSSGGSSSSIKSCPAAGGGQSSCPQSELDAYARCATDNCDAEYKECYGAGYASGNFSGPCGAQVTCTNKCDCADDACRKACVSDAACNTCSQKLAQCILGKCKLPCQGAQKTCADLQACCAKIADATKKSQCEAQLDAVKAAGDIGCNAVHAGFANDCK